MNKKTSSVRNTSHPDFSWAKDSGFTPPKQGGKAIPYQTLAFVPPQVNELNPLLKKLLETLLVAVKANAGIIRILPPHG